jgi:ferredoxin--NADP+ reductase
LLRDPDTYERFGKVIVTHTTRLTAELAYSEEIVAGLVNDPLIGEASAGRVLHYTTCTRETHQWTGRITTLLESGKIFTDLREPPLDPANDRAMICGSMDMIQDTKALMIAAGLNEGSNADPAEFVIEKAFAG